jgi:hypothetical protein
MSNGPFRVGVGGPVGSGKTALVERLCRLLRQTHDAFGQDIVVISLHTLAAHFEVVALNGVGDVIAITNVVTGDAGRLHQSARHVGTDEGTKVILILDLHGIAHLISVEAVHQKPRAFDLVGTRSAQLDAGKLFLQPIPIRLRLSGGEDDVVVVPHGGFMQDVLQSQIGPVLSVLDVGGCGLLVVVLCKAVGQSLSLIFGNFVVGIQHRGVAGVLGYDFSGIFFGDFVRVLGSYPSIVIS